MSFSRSGSTAPAFSFPIGYGSFTDVNASNAVFTSNVYSSFYHGDGRHVCERPDRRGSFF